MATQSEALSLIARLKVGDAVVLTQDGNDLHVTVQKELHHADGFGHVYSQQVKVGYGPGRWNREVSVNTIADGFVALRRDES